jgi:hypothetical protein
VQPYQKLASRPVVRITLRFDTIFWEDAVTTQVSRSARHTLSSRKTRHLVDGGYLAPTHSGGLELAKPLANRLFFAGEATQSDAHHATVHGAFASGWLVAQEALERLGP